MRSIRIGAGSGLLGDRLEPALEMIERGDITYLAMDSLGEIVVAELMKRRLEDPSRGYADVSRITQLLLPPCLARGVKVIANAGGMNPLAGAKRALQLAGQLGLKGLKMAAVEGCELAGEEAKETLRQWRAAGVRVRNMETGEELGTIEDRLNGIAVYFGAEPIVEALSQGADFILTGRCADPCLWLGPIAYEFAWPFDDWDRLAAGIVVGHLLECTGQVTGGNFTDWRDVPDTANLGYPIAEVFETGEAFITKTPRTGGMVTLATCKEELVYEIGDPRNYLTPDVIADFTTINLEKAGVDRVRVSGVKGRPRPDTLKALIGYHDGYLAEGYIAFSHPDALEKARWAEGVLRQRLEAVAGIEALKFDYIGLNAMQGPLAPKRQEPIAEVMLRLAVKSHSREQAARVQQEFYPFYVSGPSGTGGFLLPPVRELNAIWPTLVPREFVKTKITLMEAA